MKACFCGCGTQIPYSRVYAVGHNRRTTARWAGHDPLKPTQQCSYCDVYMVSHAAWRTLTPEQRKAADFTRAGAHGWCDRCYKGVRRANDPTRVPGRRSPTRRREDMLEEWEMLRSDGVTDVGQAAERMGVTKDALQKCLERARKAGDSRGVVYRNDQLGGYGQTSTGRHTSRRAA